MAYSVNDGLFLVLKDGSNGEVARFVTEGEAQADAEARTLASGATHAVYKAEWKYARISTPSIEITDI